MAKVREVLEWFGIWLAVSSFAVAVVITLVMQVPNGQ